MYAVARTTGQTIYSGDQPRVLLKQLLSSFPKKANGSGRHEKPFQVGVTLIHATAIAKLFVMTLYAELNRLSKILTVLARG